MCCWTGSQRRTSFMHSEMWPNPETPPIARATARRTSSKGCHRTRWGSQQREERPEPRWQQKRRLGRENEIQPRQFFIENDPRDGETKQRTLKERDSKSNLSSCWLVIVIGYRVQCTFMGQLYKGLCNCQQTTRLIQILLVIMHLTENNALVYGT